MTSALLVEVVKGVQQLREVVAANFRRGCFDSEILEKFALRNVFLDDVGNFVFLAGFSYFLNGRLFAFVHLNDIGVRDVLVNFALLVENVVVVLRHVSVVENFDSVPFISAVNAKENLGCSALTNFRLEFVAVEGGWAHRACCGNHLRV